MNLMKTAKLYDTGYGENKYNSSFEQYLTSYQEPFIFMNATLTAYDKLVLAMNSATSAMTMPAMAATPGWTCRNSSPRVWNI